MKIGTFQILNNGGDNSLGLVFQSGQYSYEWKYWSSSITRSNSNYVYLMSFTDGSLTENYYPQNYTYSSLYIRNLDGTNTVTPEDGITQSDVDAAYDNGYSEGAASVTPGDGITQADVDAAHAMREAEITQLTAEMERVQDELKVERELVCKIVRTCEWMSNTISSAWFCVDTMSEFSHCME